VEGKKEEKAARLANFAAHCSDTVLVRWPRACHKKGYNVHNVFWDESGMNGSHRSKEVQEQQDSVTKPLYVYNQLP